MIRSHTWAQDPKSALYCTAHSAQPIGKSSLLLETKVGMASLHQMETLLFRH